MKSTNERLVNAYCEPVTKEDWIELGYDTIPKFSAKGQRVFYATKDEDGNVVKDMDLKDSRGQWLTELIPCAQFADLIHDRITPWRLLEDGFDTMVNGFAIDVDRRGLVILSDRVVFDGASFYGIKTYTDLLNLIRLIG